MNFPGAGGSGGGGGGCGQAFGYPGYTFRGASKAYEEEDRTRDWYCSKCRERNFVKRAECFKCRAPKPKDGDPTIPPQPSLPQSGATLNGMVKSYNRKGFGFIMCLGMENCQDIYYTRDHLSPALQTRDIPGQHVTFEIQRFPDGKLTARNIRPLGEEGKSFGKGVGVGSVGFGKNGGKEEEERNFVKRFDCFSCSTPRAPGACGFSNAPTGFVPPAPRRSFSPHAGSRAVRESLAAAAMAVGGGGGACRDSTRSRSRGRMRTRTRNSSDSRGSSSSSSRARKKKSKKKKKKKKKKKRSRSSDSSSDSDRSRSEGGSKSDSSHEDSNAARSGAAAALKLQQPVGNPDIEKAKAEALDELVKLRKVEPKEARMSEWRALLRRWHPDKNPERQEVATAVFQFLQKGKPMLEAK